MRAWVLTACLLTLLPGCATQPYLNSHIESVNTEYRQLEDYVYALEEENTRLHQENERLRTGVPTRTPASGATPSRGGAIRRSPAGTTPRSQPPAADTSPGFDQPQIEVPGSSPPTGRSTTQRPDLNSTDPSETPPSIAPPRPLTPSESNEPDNGREGEAPTDLLPVPGMREIRAPVTPDPISPKPIDKKITHLFLHPSLTGGADFDGRPGDDGLRIVVEPRNAGDQFVAEAGTLSLVVLDPDREGEAARIARWDFDQSATRQLLVASSPGRGLKIEVPWPTAPPAVNRLKLFVRYETPDGRRLQADREIFVTQPGQSLSRWTPRSSEVQLSNFNAQPSTPSIAPEQPRQPESPLSSIPAIPIWSPQR
jgi:hypothetical protein